MNISKMTSKEWFQVESRQSLGYEILYLVYQCASWELWTKWRTDPFRRWQITEQICLYKENGSIQRVKDQIEEQLLQQENSKHQKVREKKQTDHQKRTCTFEQEKIVGQDEG